MFVYSFQITLQVWKHTKELSNPVAIACMGCVSLYSYVLLSSHIPPLSVTHSLRKYFSVYLCIFSS